MRRSGPLSTNSGETERPSPAGACLELPFRLVQITPASSGGFDLPTTVIGSGRVPRPIGANVFGMFSSKLPQNRHPERSASQIYRVTQRLVARSRRTPEMLILPMPFTPFQPPKPAPRAPATVFPAPRTRTGRLQCTKRCTPDHQVRTEERICSRAWVVEKLRTASTR
jgi:hypothetical protein